MHEGFLEATDGFQAANDCLGHSSVHYFLLIHSYLNMCPNSRLRIANWYIILLNPRNKHKAMVLFLPVGKVLII